MDDTSLTVTARRRHLTSHESGHRSWQVEESTVALDIRRTALLLCDVWDAHWCSGAERRLEALLPRMAATASDLRARGALVVHAPSETMQFYDGSPARQRALEPPQLSPPEPPAPEPPALPVATIPHGSCDTCGDQANRVWTRQHSAIAIDDGVDVISDSGTELYSLYRHRAITSVLIMGVHTNMCVLDRPFTIKAMVTWGLQPFLVRDLTDAMYDPADPPYVNHDEGTELVIEYIEKFWCPSVTSEMLLSDVPR